MNDLNLVDFLEPYLTSKFSDFKISGQNMMTNCIFCNDYKKKLGVHLNSGQYHCFICEAKGEFVSLYAKLENMSVFQAQIHLNYKTFLAEPKPKQSTKTVVSVSSLEDEINTFDPLNLESHDSDCTLTQKAWCYLYSRKLFDLQNLENNSFYICKEGRFSNRLILPYIYKQHILYFQGRSLIEGLKPKYLNLDASYGVRSADILYPFLLSSREIVVCEGPIDARSLQLQGVNATCTTGCSMSNNQIEILKNWGGKIIIGYDNDSAGLRGIEEVDKLRKRKNMSPIHFCHPPSGFKDWNEAHVANVDLKSWVRETTKEYRFENIILEKLSQLEM